MAVDTLGHLLALHVTPANADGRVEVGRIAKAIQAETGESVEIAFVDQGYTGEKPAAAAPEHGIAVEVVKAAGGQARLRPAAKTMGGRAILRLGHPVPTARQRLRCAQTLGDLPLVAFACVMPKTAAKLRQIPNSL